MNRTPRDRFVTDLHGQRHRLGLSAGDVHVATVLATRYSDPYLRVSWPAQRTLATATGMCERAVRYCLDRLETAGVLAVERHAPRQVERGQWTRRTNRYRFMWKRLRAWATRRFAPPSPQRAPRGNRLPHEPPNGGQATPVVPEQPPPGGVAVPDDPGDDGAAPRTQGADAAMAAARDQLRRRGRPAVGLALPLTTGWTALRAGREGKGAPA